MTDSLVALLVASPWILAPAITMWRVSRSRELASTPATLPPNAPLVSVVIPARDEARTIESCVRSVLASSYPNVEVIVVDDRSSDGTGDIVRSLAQADPRVRVVENDALPDEWFGKPWACTTGARASATEIICFTDADARHGEFLVARAVNAMRSESLDLLTVAGRQELGSFWERVIQPHVFWMLANRYGGTESVNRSRRVEDKIANGQCIFVRRNAYDAIGGHEAVRDQVAEDVALAQRFFAAGKRTALFIGHLELTTRMYTSLREVMAGWRKNVYVGGREAMPWGMFGQAIFPALLLLAPLLTVAPALVLLVAIAVAAPAWLTLAASYALLAQLVTWALVYRWMDAPIRYALIFPLGAIVFGVIALQAIARGSRVEWKGRAYVTSSGARRTSRRTHAGSAADRQ